MNFPTPIALSLAVVAVALSSCATPDKQADQSKSDTSQSTPAAGASSGAGLVAENTKGGFNNQDAGPKVDANKGSEADLKAAFAKLEVKDPDKWLPIVVQNRPYKADDQYMNKLRTAMKAQGADEDTQDRVVSVLQVND